MKRVFMLVLVFLMVFSGCFNISEEIKTNEWVLTKRKTIYYDNTNSVTEIYYRKDGQPERQVSYNNDDYENSAILIYNYDDRGFITSIEAVGESVVYFYSSFKDGYYVCVPTDKEFGNSTIYTYRKDGSLYSKQEGQTKEIFDVEGNTIEYKCFENFCQNPHEEIMASYYTYDKGKLIKAEHCFNENEELNSVEEYKYINNNDYEFEYKCIDGTGKTTYKIMKKLDKRTFRLETVGDENSYALYFLDSFGNLVKISTYIKGELYQEIHNEWTEI